MNRWHTSLLMLHKNIHLPLKVGIMLKVIELLHMFRPNCLQETKGEDQPVCCKGSCSNKGEQREYWRSRWCFCRWYKRCWEYCSCYWRNWCAHNSHECCA